MPRIFRKHGFPAIVLGVLLLLSTPQTLWASPTEVVKAVFHKPQSGTQWQVSVTLRHADTGWKHYAKVWVVETLDGKELGRRVLFHPHENEQPFTRDGTITIPAGIAKVRVRAGEILTAMDSNTVLVDLTKSKGERFEVR